MVMSGQDRVRPKREGKDRTEKDRTHMTRQGETSGTVRHGKVEVRQTSFLGP